MIYVLLLEDVEHDAILLKQLLEGSNSKEYKLVHVSTVAAAVKELKKHTFNVIISDITLSCKKGETKFQTLQELALDIPIIFSAITHDDEIATKALEDGGADYLLKGDLDRNTLQRSIHYAIERKKNQREIERLNANESNLRKEVKYLRMERVQLSELNKAKDDFLSIASHQLRTPATGVKQYLGMVLEGFCGPVTDAQRTTLQEANRSNERQLKIITDILKTAQLDAGHITMNMKDCDIVTMIKQIVNEQGLQFTQRRQTVHITHSTKKITIPMDEYHLRMALENIIENASKYTPVGKSIHIDIHSKQKHIVVTIRDEGVGMNTKDYGKIFDKFTRVTNSMSQDVSGSGLGLYWSKCIIDLHKGTISIDSIVNVGTTFTIELPFKNSVTDHSDKHSSFTSSLK